MVGFAEVVGEGDGIFGEEFVQRRLGLGMMLIILLLSGSFMEEEEEEEEERLRVCILDIPLMIT